MTFLNPTAQYGVDSSTLHRWILNDASGSTTFANKGSSGVSLTIQNTSNVNLGDVGFYSDCANFVANGATGGWGESSANTGTPTSTTALSVHCWQCPRTFTNQYPRLIARGYNSGFTTPFDSLGMYMAHDIGDGAVAIEWASGGSLTQIALGPTSSTARGYVQLNQWQHTAVTISIAAGTATLKYYWNGNLITTSTTASGVIDWNGGSGGSWVVGGVVASAPIGNATFDGWIFDARVDDGIARSAAYFKSLYKAGKGYVY